MFFLIYFFNLITAAGTRGRFYQLTFFDIFWNIMILALSAEVNAKTAHNYLDGFRLAVLFISGINYNKYYPYYQ